MRLGSTCLQRTSRKGDDAWNRFFALVVVCNHTPADAERLGGLVEGIRFPRAPRTERICRHRRAGLLLCKAPERVRRHIDFIGPDDIGSVLAVSHLPERLDGLPERRIKPEALDL